MNQSLTLQVRDAILKRIRYMPFFNEFKFSSNKSLPIQPENLPFCGVYLIEEVMSPEGDANAGEPHFHVAARIAISVVIVNNDADVAERKIDAAQEVLTNGLFSDPTLYNGKHEAFEIQSYNRGLRSHWFGSIGADNKTPVAELRFELTVDMGTYYYPPVVPDELDTIHVTTRWPVGGTEGQIQGTQQVQAEYDLEVEP
jgi:hypothetical protein